MIRQCPVIYGSLLHRKMQANPGLWRPANRYLELMQLLGVVIPAPAGELAHLNLLKAQ